MNNVTDRMVEAAWKAYVEARDGKPMRAAIEAALREQPAPEPVAWRWTESNGKHWFDWSTDWNHHDRAKDMGFPTQYAYTAAPQQRKPLTEEEIESIWRQKPRWHAPPIGTTDIEFARAVERAHGIGGEE